MEATPHHETFTLPAEGHDEARGRLLAMLEEMMEAAGRHAGKLGVGVRDLHAKGLTWVLARLHARILAVPPAGGEVHVVTWPSGRHRIFAVREFQLKDRGGTELLRATSAWAMMSMETRRPSRLDPHLQIFSRHPERMIEDDFPPLPPVSRISARRLYRAEPGDIDLNDHVNSTVYLGWALHAAQAETRRAEPHSLEAAFLGEARLGDEVACLTENRGPGGDLFLAQSLRDAASGRELTRLRTRWKLTPFSPPLLRREGAGGELL